MEIQYQHLFVKSFINLHREIISACRNEISLYTNIESFYFAMLLLLRNII